MIGQTLSHYRITAALGAGGMGEAQLLAALNHPNVGAIYGLEEAPRPDQRGLGTKE